MITEHVTPNHTRTKLDESPGRGGKPKHDYYVNDVLVPSVTQILDTYNKPSLPWWGMTVGVEGVLRLRKAGFVTYTPSEIPIEKETEHVVDLLKSHRLTINHVKGEAARRGNVIH